MQAREEEEVADTAVEAAVAGLAEAEWEEDAPNRCKTRTKWERLAVEMEVVGEEEDLVEEAMEVVVAGMDVAEMEGVDPVVAGQAAEDSAAEESSGIQN